MKTHRDPTNTNQQQQNYQQQHLIQQQYQDYQQNYQLHPDSPKQMQNRQQNHQEFNHISPIVSANNAYTNHHPAASTGASVIGVGVTSMGSILNEKNQKDNNNVIINMKEKKMLQNNASQKNLATVKQSKNGYAQENHDTNYDQIQQRQQMMISAQEFYKRPTSNLQINNNFQYNNESNKTDSEQEDFISDNDNSLLQNLNQNYAVGNAKQINIENQINIYGAPSSLNTYSQSTGSNNNKQGQINKKDQKQGIQTCTEFDLTAKEINSNKRFENKLKKNTIISGGFGSDHSPIDGQPSNSETVKWAFTNKDSQETQKKISIINRESINNGQDMISRSLKSHDSRAQLSQQTTSQKNNILKGKMLDFANMDQNQKNLDSGLFYQQTHNIINSEDDERLQSNDSQFKLEEEKMISFLEDGTEILMSSNKKFTGQNLNGIQQNLKNVAGIAYRKQSQNLQNNMKNRKYCSLLKFNLPDNMQSMIENTQDCPLCNKQKVFDSSLQCSQIEDPKSCQDIVMINLNKKYLTSREYYNVKIINDIIYNETTNIVSVFKDYLIFDDISEFLKRFYQRQESIQRLPKMYEFYEKFSKVFPNYVTLPENKYLFKNIEKKQRIIDEKQRILQEQDEKKQREANGNGFQLGNSGEKGHAKSRHRDRFSSQQMGNSSMYSQMSTNRMFNTQFIDSVNNIQASGFIEKSSMMSSRINNSQYQEHVLNSSILIHQHLQQNMENAAKIKQQKQKKALQDLDFGELISKFIAKDSHSTLQQSSLMFQTMDKDILQNQIQQQQQQQPASIRPVSQQQLVKKPQVYDYQESMKNQQKQNVQQPQAVGGSTILNTENSKSMSENSSNNAISGRPTSSKPQIDRQKIKIQPQSDMKQLSQQQLQQPIISARHQQKQNEVKSNMNKPAVNVVNTDQNQMQQQLQNQQQQPSHQPTSSNHLIINNFLQDKNQVQKQCDIIINIASSNIITNQNMPSDRNYYGDVTNNGQYNIHYNSSQQQQQQELARIKVISNQDGQQQIVHIPQQNMNTLQQDPQQHANEAKMMGNNNQGASSRQGSLQRNQSRSNLHNMQSSQKSIENNKNCQTPNRASSQQKEVKTPGSGKAGDSNQIKTNLVQQKILKRIKQQNKQDLLQNQHDLQQNMMSLSGNNKSASVLQKTQNYNDNTSSPLNIYTQRQQIYTMNANSVKGGSTEAVVSRELSKERNRQQAQQQVVNLMNKQNALFVNPGQTNQMFKNDIIGNLNLKQNMNNQAAEYNKAGISNVRSVERLTKIEEEIQKDYSKYVNEYGLSKTAFAKAVNALREKQQNSNSKQQPSQATSTRQARLMQNSNEKKRNSSNNNPRSISTSQNRKQSNSRQQNVKTNLQAQESINDIYLNTNRNDQKQIRSVRAKTHLNSQNSSSCFQRSQKLSPDKISTSQYGLQNMLGMTQNITTNNFNSNNSNYITLKAQPSKQNKGIKIKFPINNNQRANSKNNQNSSQTQTPKRLKLQKTKSTSNIPIAFTQRGQLPQSQVLLSHRGRFGGGNDMVIMDEMSQQMNSTNPAANSLQYIPLQNNGRASQNFQDMYSQGGNGQDNQNTPNVLMMGGSGIFPHQAFNSNSCLGTYTTTSILNSPLSFKNNVGFVQQNQQAQQQNQQSTRNNSKGRQSSRNGGNSQHQSQKSIGGNQTHQRASSNNGVLQSSTNKQKKSTVTIIPNNESKRMSAGSNMSKKTTPVHHQASGSNMQQQILQLLMTYQTNQSQQQQFGDQCDVTGTSSLQQNFLPTQQNSTLRMLQGNNTQSMKDLKSMKQQTPSTLMKDLQIIKAPKNQSNQVGIILQQAQPAALNTQRQVQGISSNLQSIMMVDNQNSRKINKTGKLTARGESSKKRVIQQQNIVNPYYSNIGQNNDCTTSISTNNHYSNLHGNVTSNDLSSRIQNSIGGIGFNYGDNTASQIDTKRLLSQSKSQENFDMFRVAAQRAAMEQQQQSASQIGYQSTTNKFLQNLKQQENQVPSKIKMLPSNTYSQLPLHSARNMQFDSNSNIKNQQNDSDTKLGNNQQNQVQFNKGATTNIIIGQNNFDKQSQSRRTSGKFNPQSTRSNQQQ